MYQSSYYREQAARARRLARGTTDREVVSILAEFTRNYDEIAEDLDRGAIEIRHPELMPQGRR
jgi:hypothetical protein